jgi:PAS domain S-box-containing protein
MRESEFALLRDPRLAVHATSAMPVWLWSVDASRILWANAVGAAVFGASTSADAADLRLDPSNPAAAQIERLAASLPQGGQVRLERLRGFGAGFARMLICACSRLALADKPSAILVVATEPAGPSLTLAERVRRLFGEDDHPLAIFSPDGTLLHATPSTKSRLAGATTVSELGLEALAAEALASGHAATAPFTIDRIGSQSTTALVVGFAAQPLEAVHAEPTPSSAEPLPAVPPPPAAEPTPIPQAQADSPPAPPLRMEDPSAASASVEPSPAAEPQDKEAEAPASERRHPLRFVWQMDADRHFVIGSDEFIELMGPHTTAAFGRSWDEIATALHLDPDGHVERALGTRETWSGVTVSWPVDGANERLPVEMSGLPVFDRDRRFRGYRGFGVCRDLDRINELARTRRTRPLGFIAAPEAALPDDAIAATAAASESVPDAHSPELERQAAAELAKPNIVPPTANVVPFRSIPSVEPRAPTLSAVERNAFRELAQELTSRLKRDTPAETPVPLEAIEPGVATEAPRPAAAASAATDDDTPVSPPGGPPAEEALSSLPDAPAEAATMQPLHRDTAPTRLPPQRELAEQAVLDRIPVGVLVYRHDSLLYANRAFLEWTGYDSLTALAEAGGLDSLFVDPAANPAVDAAAGTPLSIATHRGGRLPVEGRLFTVPWHGESALALIVANGQIEDKYKAAELALRSAEADARDLQAVLDTATDGVMMLAHNGNVLAANRSAEVLFGCDAGELDGRAFGELFASDSTRAALDYFDRIVSGASVVSGGLDVTARTDEGRPVTLSLSVGRIGSGDRFCAVFRDLTDWKKIEEELRATKRDTQRAAAAKADFLAKVSHEIRTPLNAMTGFAEVMMAERFGPIGNERYRTYLKDIHASGNHLVSLLNDLLDLSKIEAGKLDLTFANVNLNELTQQCVGIMQPQANKERIIIRTSLAHGLPQVVADARSVRQIVLNLLSNSVKFTGPGGQVIVSTALSDDGEAVLRVRDTGIGMSERDIDAALEPFRQIATSGSWGSGGSGLGLPLTRALAEANRASFSIKSAPSAGTLIEVAFPPTRVLAE